MNRADLEPSLIADEGFVIRETSARARRREGRLSCSLASRSKKRQAPWRSIRTQVRPLRRNRVDRRVAANAGRSATRLSMRPFVPTCAIAANARSNPLPRLESPCPSPPEPFTWSVEPPQSGRGPAAAGLCWTASSAELAEPVSGTRCGPMPPRFISRADLWTSPWTFRLRATSGRRECCVASLCSRRQTVHLESRAKVIERSGRCRGRRPKRVHMTVLRPEILLEQGSATGFDHDRRPAQVGFA